MENKSEGIYEQMNMESQQIEDFNRFLPQKLISNCPWSLK